MQTTLDRFMSKVQVDDSTGCWEWQAWKDKLGRGTFKYKNITKTASRISYEIFVQPIEDGMFICHTCDNPGCVNPCHLFQGTHKDNMEDMVSKGRGYKPFGEKNIHSVLTTKEVLLIRKFLERFPPTRKKSSGSFGAVKFLGEWFGVSNHNITYIHQGKSWTHVN